MKITYHEAESRVYFYLRVGRKDDYKAIIKDILKQAAAKGFKPDKEWMGRYDDWKTEPNDDYSNGTFGTAFWFVKKVKVNKKGLFPF